MIPISRKDAKLTGLKIYFTGQPCKHGHIAYRYTISGACSKCVNPNSSGQANAVREEQSLQIVAQRNDALQQLTEINLRARPVDVPVLRDTVLAITLARFPQLTPLDVAVKFAGIAHACGTAMYRFNVHPDDYPFLLECSNALLFRNPVDLSPVRAKLSELAMKVDGPIPKNEDIK